jgi:hypothetical protein
MSPFDFRIGNSIVILCLILGFKLNSISEKDIK